MANNNKHTGPNVPALRFPEFSGEWTKIKLGDLGSFFSGGTPSSSRKDFYGGEIPFIRSGELHSDSTALSITKEAYDSCSAKMVNKGDLLLALYGATSGDISISRISGAINQAILCIRPQYMDAYFIKSLWEKHKKHILETYLQGGQGNLSSEIIKNISFFFPNSDEQVKISRLIHIIDDRIETQSKIIEELTALRSALYDSMFCSPEQEMPKFRIQSFSGKWQLCQLNEICSRKSIKNKDNLYSRVLTIAAQHGLVDQESFFKKRIASENLESYLCLEKGDFAYNKSYSSDYPWGAVKRLSNFDKGIISPLYICFTPKPEVVDPDYLAHYFESTKWHSGISEISGEGARNHGLLNMSVIDYFNTCHRIPGLDEQKAIARRLNAIAHKLQTEQEYLELLNRQKDCFLKQMFI